MIKTHGGGHRSLSIGGDEVHVWSVPLDHRPSVRDYIAMLDEVERHRASRFFKSIDRDRYVVAHCVLRSLLSGYLGVPPLLVRFDYTSSGKPLLHVGERRSGLHFNLSHSSSLALVAVSRWRDVGVDLESFQHHEDRRCPLFAISSPRELRWMDEERMEPGIALGRLWTRKEAYLKARGEGVPARGLDEIDVMSRWGDIVDMRSGASLLDVCWRGYDLALPGSHAGAVVVRGEVGSVRQYSVTSFDGVAITYEQVAEGVCSATGSGLLALEMQS